ncbi:MAG TPA: HAD hydrolase-like protein [Bacteroidales bacterium]|nr:HAD hydrolase-like protein [Bacteroidales bacterium]
MDFQKQLRDLTPEHDFFAGIDSDGCVFDTMEVKQKEFFIPLALRYFNLFQVSKAVRETWEFVNLYSVNRGNNRFIALLKVVDLLSERQDIIESGVTLPDLSRLREWTVTESKLGNSTLRKYFEATGYKSLEPILKWSEALNREISEWLHKVSPFMYVRETIDSISSFADILVVSQTPLEALEHEWHTNDIRRYARMIAAQEHGTKTEHIALAAKQKYPDNKILMIGDAIGDLDAARKNGVLFFPVIPGKENESWHQLMNVGIEKFRKGTFRGTYENSLIDSFLKALPENPSWKSIK